MLVLIVTVRGYQPLILPDTHADKQCKFDATTSYVSRFLNECRKPSYLRTRLPSKILSLEFLKQDLVYGSYTEPMAGFGLSARILGRGEHRLYDYSQECVDTLNRNFSTSASRADIHSLSFVCSDLVYLDFNNYTYRRRDYWKKVLDYTFCNTAKYVIINDCTPFYFRYGASSYKVYSRVLGREIRSTEDYFSAIADSFLGWHLTKVGYFRDSSFQLFTRTSDPIEVYYVSPERIPEGIVRVEEGTRLAGC